MAGRAIEENHGKWFSSQTLSAGLHRDQRPRIVTGCSFGNFSKCTFGC
jgi:hypothetical protein